jgi:hypothetical protein
MTSAEPDKSDRWDFFLAQAAAKLQQQIDWADSLDTKASIVIGFAGVVLAVAADSGISRTLLRTGAMLALLAPAALGLWAYRLTLYDVPPDVQALWEKYYDVHLTTVKETLTSTLVEACASNRARLQSKATWLTRAQAALFIALAVFVLAQSVGA